MPRTRRLRLAACSVLAAAGMLALAALLASCGPKEESTTTPPPARVQQPPSAPGAPPAQTAHEHTIVVNGGYEPKTVTVKKDQPAKLHFQRSKDDG